MNYDALVGEFEIPADTKEISTDITIIPVDNDDRSPAPLGFKVTVRVGKTNLITGIKIVDDETPSDRVTLKAEPDEITAGTTETITITAELNGKPFEDDVPVTLVLRTAAVTAVEGGVLARTAGNAQRDTDYDVVGLRTLEIPAGDLTGTTTIDITAIKGGDKTIVVRALKDEELRKNEIDDPVKVIDVVITLKDAETGEETDSGVLVFEADIKDSIYEFVVGEEKEVPLVDVTGGAEGDKTYSTSALPDGLVFDEETLTIEGTPTAAGETTVFYTVIDSEGASVATTVKIQVDEAPLAKADVESVEFSQASVREDADATPIMVTAVLAAPAETEETVTFVIGGGDPAAKRDTDYNMVLAPSNSAQVTIAVDEMKASTTYMLTPVPNEDADGDKFISVTATASGEPASNVIKIADDDTESTSISLSADPHTVKEDAGLTVVTVTATLSGKVLEEDAEVIIRIDDASSSAKREVDYTATYSARLSIPQDAISGSIEFALSPEADGEDEGNESFTLAGTPGENIADLTVSSATITLEDTEAAPEDRYTEEEEETPEPDHGHRKTLHLLSVKKLSLRRPRP